MEIISLFIPIAIAIFIYVSSTKNVSNTDKTLNENQKPKTEIVIKENNNAEEELVNLVKKIKK